MLKGILAGWTVVLDADGNWAMAIEEPDETGCYQIRRRDWRRGQYVNLGRTFTGEEMLKICNWVGQQHRPLWDKDWKPFFRSWESKTK